jgi:pseudaminic acid synthase
MKMNFEKLKRCFIIAEVSANHGQNFNRAIAMIKKAKECGADAVKFQCYTPDTLTIDAKNEYFRIKHGKWGGQTLYQLYQKTYTPWKWFKKLKEVADDIGIKFFATVFDTRSVDFLEELDVAFHKIASFELVDLPLIEYTAKTRKPLILSTGMASLPEIKDAVGTAIKAGAREVILLKCVSSYPARPEEMNLRTIPDLKKRFKVPVGLSDHTLGIGVSLAAVSLGAQIVEKHFILTRKIKTPDSFFSIEPQELKSLVENIRIAEKSLGKVHYGLTEDEKKNRVFRRSIFAVKDIKRGDLFSEENIRSIRPGQGLPPRYLNKIIGHSSNQAIKCGTALKWEYVQAPGENE